MWDLLHAWREWLAGHDTAQLRVFGVTVLWWGRLGKTLEFLGGLTVVLDLLGRQRMESVHAALRARRRRLVNRLRRRPAPPPARSDAHEQGLRVAWSLGTIFVGLFVFAGTHYAYAPPNDPMPVGVVVLFVALAAPILGGLVGGGGYLLGLLLVEGLVVTTLGQLPTREGLESRLKWLGLGIFVFGFSLDLLSS
ncbi:hypothetical protein VSH64_07290 [Amycolatopsis rhabdoformis]|uniref:Uncharacterized protein n=1 Tax=Amycolatopsis rhabdoformis TaxID=1448059 RepID=A0ABZ1ICH8_9PSEU|nr:hypothetical protein [Amycolatopsis rhabdoformis]WSE31912.1 hypothetical protein VSH64_07290 [Amycolatopsis rhabdoformis]